MFCSVILMPLRTACWETGALGATQAWAEEQEGLCSKAGSGGSSCVRSSWPLRTCDGDQHRSALTTVHQMKHGRVKCRGGNYTACGSCSQAGAPSPTEPRCLRVRVSVSACLCICVCVVDDCHFQDVLP